MFKADKLLPRSVVPARVSPLKPHREGRVGLLTARSELRPSRLDGAGGAAVGEDEVQDLWPWPATAFPFPA